MDMAGRMIRRGILGGTTGSYKMELGFQSSMASSMTTGLGAGHLVATQQAVEERHNENAMVEWAPDDPDALVISRLKQATAAVHLQEERVTVTVAARRRSPGPPQGEPAGHDDAHRPPPPSRDATGQSPPRDLHGPGVPREGSQGSEAVQPVPQRDPALSGAAGAMEGLSRPDEGKPVWDGAVRLVPPPDRRMSRGSGSADGSTWPASEPSVPPLSEAMTRGSLSLDGELGELERAAESAPEGEDPLQPTSGGLAIVTNAESVSKGEDSQLPTSGGVAVPAAPLDSDVHEPGAAGEKTGMEEERPHSPALVTVTLGVTPLPPVLRHVSFSRHGASGNPSSTLLATLMGECELEELWRLRCSEGLVPVWEPTVLDRLHVLRILNLNHCALSSIPPGIGSLGTLRELRVAHNKLTALPREIGSLTHLQKLVADNNLLANLPGGDPAVYRAPGSCRLSPNRLASPVLDLRQLGQLRSLQLFGNPLEFLPELSSCPALRHLSLANVRLRADLSFTQWDVEVSTGSSYIGRATSNKLTGLYTLIFRRSSCQHPLMAGALAKVAEEPAQCAAMAREVGAVQQILLMAISENDIVVEQACQTIDKLAQHVPSVMEELLESDVVASMLSLVQRQHRIRLQLAGLGVLSSLAASSLITAERLLRPDLVASLLDAIRGGTDDVRAAALEVVGNLALPAPEPGTSSSNTWS
eukprot:jgi/Botrbrau1/12755/Bobra.67_1s0114.1